jgi:hypothetical protein
MWGSIDIIRAIENAAMPDHQLKLQDQHWILRGKQSCLSLRQVIVIAPFNLSFYFFAKLARKYRNYCKPLDTSLISMIILVY